jgi:hypothetical protein
VSFSSILCRPATIGTEELRPNACVNCLEKIHAYHLCRSLLFSFHPETVLFRPSYVNPQACLCGVLVYASAQTLDFDSSGGLALRAAFAVNFCRQKFLARTKKPSFPN